jgi:hypothetical protein
VKSNVRVRDDPRDRSLKVNCSEINDKIERGIVRRDRRGRQKERIADTCPSATELSRVNLINPILHGILYRRVQLCASVG